MSQAKAKPKSEVNIPKYLGAIAIGVAIALIPPPAGLTSQSMQFLGIFIGMIAGMLMNAAQMWVMTNTAALFTVTLGLASFKEVYAEFAGTTIWMVLSVVAFAGCLSGSGLMKRIAFTVLKIFPPSFTGQALAILTASTAIGPLIPSSTAKLAVMAPFTAQIAAETGLAPHSRGLKGLFFVMFTAAFIAAPIFLTGSNITFIMLGMIPSEVAAPFTWMYWFQGAAVWGIVTLALTAIYTVIFLKPETPISMSKDFISEKIAEMGPMSANEKTGLITLVFAMVMWITVEMHGINATVVSWVALLVMHFTGQFGSRDVAKMPWALCLMFGPMMGVVALMRPLGVSDWIASMLGGVSALIPNAFVFIIVTTLLTWVMRLVIDQISILAIAVAIFGPIAASLGINMWIVIFLAWVNAQQWVLPHNNISIFQTLGMMGGDDVLAYKDVQSLTFVHMAISLVASLASVPMWKIMGLM